MNFGQFFDRAVSLYARSFVPVALLLGVVAVPFALLSGAYNDPTLLLNDYVRLINDHSHDPAVHRALLAAIRRDQRIGLTADFLFVVSACFSLLASTAAYIYATAVEDGTGASITAAYRRAAMKWPAQVVLALIGGVVLGVAGIALAVPAIILAVILGIAKLLVLVTFVVVVVAAIVSLAFLMFETSMMQVAHADVALGRRGPFGAFAAAVRATFDRRRWRTTLAFGAATLALTLFLLLCDVLIAALLAALHASALVLVLSTFVRVVVGGLVAFLIALYASDLERRRSGSDLLALAAASGE